MRTWLALYALAGLLAMLTLYFHRRRIVGSRIADFILPWPLLESETSKGDASRRQSEALEATKDRIKYANLVALTELRDQLTSLRDEEDARRTSIDSRLATIVGLSSIAVTVATGLIVSQASGAIRLSTTAGRVSLSVAAFYILIQLCDAVYWAIRGQERQGYQTDTIQDMLPQPGASAEDVLRQRLIRWVEQYNFNQIRINGKVTALAVAHRASMNFLLGVLLLCVSAIVVMEPSSTTASVVAAIQSDPRIQEELRGPIGPVGPQGPPGSVGQGIHIFEQQTACPPAASPARPRAKLNARTKQPQQPCLGSPSEN